MNEIQKTLISYFLENGPVNRKEITNQVGLEVSASTVKRHLLKLQEQGWIKAEGKGKATVYVPTDNLKLTFPVDLANYFEKEQDDRKIHSQFDLEIFKKLKNTAVFSEKELLKLNQIQQKFQNQLLQFSESEYQKEMERLAIDLSWKSSQIEGNTYSLLETEILLKEKKTASGKTKEEAIMLLNHKESIDFLLNNRDYVSTLSVRTIEDLHSILTKGLGINRNIRQRRVGITGTNYNPLDNEFQIKEALEMAAQLINTTILPYEKAFLTLVLISYIQPFMDGNKRTARILSNGILLSNAHCPLSFRTVDPLEYKKAMLIFYEQTNLSAMKKIFIEQAEFAVNTYF